MVEERVLKNGHVIIPKGIRDQLDIHEGDKVRIDIDENNIIISKQSSISDKLKSMAEKHGSKVSIQEIKGSLKKRSNVKG